MEWFAKGYSEQVLDGTWLLGITFLSLSASIIYISKLIRALVTTPINKALGYRAVFVSASLYIITRVII
ncbi:hypothetical protein BJX64DRAFT_261526 [Aspergillus heterothallicus]